MHRTITLLSACGFIWTTPAIGQETQPLDSQDGTEGEQPVAETDSEISGSLTVDGSATADSPAAAAVGEEDSTSAQDASIPPYAGARATRSELTLSQRYSRLPYMQRYAPEGNLWEVSLFVGMFFPSPSHNLKVAVLPREEFSPVASQVGGRLAYFPLSWLGAEAEAFGGGGSTEISNYSSLFYAMRVHGVLQLPNYSIVPFAVVGAGALAAATETMGHDRDPAFHFGLGVKVPFNHRVSARLDVRDTLSQKGLGASGGKQTHHPEVNLGVTFTFERTAPPLPADADYDGLYDHEDECPNEGALTTDGCPFDSDGDGVVDMDDECPREAGDPPDGCPQVDLDPDGDGVPIPADQCPDEAGPSPSGCPDKDTDGDGFIGKDDTCPKEPETRNGFEDDDGCPDEMPEAITRFTGVIQGINFKQGTADIEDSSHPVLDSAVEILIQFPSVRLEVSGHTSSEGTEERNQELSVLRAEAVRDYLVEKGVKADRIVARGAGASEPVADNATAEGRQKNRRIEFRILSQR